MEYTRAGAGNRRGTIGTAGICGMRCNLNGLKRFKRKMFLAPHLLQLSFLLLIG